MRSKIFSRLLPNRRRRDARFCSGCLRHRPGRGPRHHPLAIIADRVRTSTSAPSFRPPAGTVTIDADNGNRSRCARCRRSRRWRGDRAYFTGWARGQHVRPGPGAAGRGLLGPRPARRSSSWFSIGQWLYTVRTIDLVGAFKVGVGGTFAIAANQPAGLYSADFTSLPTINKLHRSIGPHSY